MNWIQLFIITFVIIRETIAWNVGAPVSPTLELRPAHDTNDSKIPWKLKQISKKLQDQQACDLARFALTSNIIEEIIEQGFWCINELFSAPESIQLGAFTDNNMYVAAERARILSTSYDATTSLLASFFLYIRAGLYVEFYNPSLKFLPWVDTAIIDAIDQFVANPYFYSNSQIHGNVLTEVLTTMDSSENQARYLEVVKSWLNRWSPEYATTYEMRNAINRIFTLLYRGTSRSDFGNIARDDIGLVDTLRNFALSDWMLDSNAEFMIINSGGELARLLRYKTGSIKSSVETSLRELFSTYEIYGRGDGVWLRAALVANSLIDCSTFGICGYKEELDSLVLQFESSCFYISVRAQDLTPRQLSSICQVLELEEDLFHAKLGSSPNQPVPNDYNSVLQVVIFNSDTDYAKYASTLFDISTNNGGIYLEGNPAIQGNIPRFIAYEASYGNPDHFVWNLEHEFVHYLDGRFNLYGDFGNPTEEVVWWAEGLAEYISKGDDYPNAIQLVRTGIWFTLQDIFDTTYSDSIDRVYRWTYLATRFMFETHLNDVQTMLGFTRLGNWSYYKAEIDTWALRYSSDFNQWLNDLKNSA